jgi:hypothetical protein
MELCGAREGCGDQRRCWGDAAQTTSFVLRGQGKTGKGSGVGDGLALAVVVLYSMLDVMELKHTSQRRQTSAMT